MTLEDVVNNSTDKAFVEKAIEEDGLFLEGACEEFRDDKELVMKAVTKDGGALEFASIRLKGDKDILMQAVEKKGYTVVATKCYIKNGLAKLVIALARGKNDHDKRETIKKREIERNIAQTIKEHNNRWIKF